MSVYSFNGRFPGVAKLTGAPFVFFLHNVSGRELGNTRHRFWPSGCPSGHQISRNKARKETQSTKTPTSSLASIILSSSTTGLLTKEALLPLRLLCDARISLLTHNSTGCLSGLPRLWYCYCYCSLLTPSVTSLAVIITQRCEINPERLLSCVKLSINQSTKGNFSCVLR